MSATVKVYLEWAALEAGNFKPVKFVPHSDKGAAAIVVVEVPVISKYVDNAEDILTNRVEGKELFPYFTPKGMRYVLDVVQDALADQPKGLDDEEVDSGEFEDDDIQPIE